MNIDYDLAHDAISKFLGELRDDKGIEAYFSVIADSKVRIYMQDQGQEKLLYTGERNIDGILGLIPVLLEDTDEPAKTVQSDIETALKIAEEGISSGN
jgi:hypothetical protein